ncbi:penicillin acylase family protein [Nonomuraea sp. NPDC049480]|uniref:penicillin acylase family protein n=1 Tax=Nonomuraea sp. NPDC049480 TaxID=3364353 RepID=UPI0037AB439A
MPFDPEHPLTTPRGLNREDPRVRRALADTVQAFQANRISPDVTLAEVQRYAQVPLHGCTDLKGCFDLVESSGSPDGEGASYEPDNGSSFIMAVELTPNGPRTRTILTYSQSANPASPHHTDQTRLYSRKQWVTERFTETEITADPHLKTTTLRA